MVLCILHEKIKKNRISRECIAYGGEEICLHGSVGNLKQSDCLKNLGVDGRIILKDVFFLSFGATAPSGPWPPHSRGF